MVKLHSLILVGEFSIVQVGRFVKGESLNKTERKAWNWGTQESATVVATSRADENARSWDETTNKGRQEGRMSNSNHSFRRQNIVFKKKTKERENMSSVTVTERFMNNREWV